MTASMAVVCLLGFLSVLIAGAALAHCLFGPDPDLEDRNR